MVKLSLGFVFSNGKFFIVVKKKYMKFAILTIFRCTVP